MSKVLKLKISNCDNKYTAEELFEKFGIDEKELKICMNCKNVVKDGGIITCKHIMNNLEGVETDEDR